MISSTRGGADRWRGARPVRALVLAALALACLGVLGASARASGAAASFRAVSAMNAYAAEQLPEPELDQQLAAMQANGVQVVRADAVWANIEPVAPNATGPVYEFEQTDQWVTELADHHLTWEPLIDFSNGWADDCPGTICAPTNDSTYATFAQAVAARYGAGGSFWAENPTVPYYPAQIFEIWDEENDASYYVAPAQFAELYVAARTEIRAVDAQAQVIVGGLADDSDAFNAKQDYPAQYVAAMFAADPGLRGNVDGFGLHPYGTTAKDAVEWVVDFRHELDKVGEGAAPIDITELGWTTGDATRENWRAWSMFDVGIQLARSDCGIRLLAPYDWINPLATSDAADFGLVDDTGLSTTLRQAGSYWFKALQQAGSMPELRLCGPAPAKPSKKTAHHKPKRKPKRHKPRRGSR